VNEFGKRLAAVGVAALALGTGFGLGTGLTGRDAVSTGVAFAQGGFRRGAEEQNLIRVVRSVAPAVVTITDGRGVGSGVIIDGKNGVILTNAHVVRRARNGTIGVRLKNAKTLTGKILGADEAVDIAVLKVDARDLPSAPLGDSDGLEVGQSAVAIGNPLGLEQTVTAGVVSAVNRRIDPDDVEGFIQTDAAINPGNSGGALIDSEGKVIGINTAVLRGNGAEGLGFAVPINVARDVARQVLNTGSVRRAIMGVIPQSITPPMAREFGLPVSEGVILGEVSPGSPAERAGLRPGDILTRADNQPLTGSGDLLRVLRAKRAGDEVALAVRRGARTFRVSVRLAPAQD
jgi:Trypsin-like serine proteases, typically periplasmic, contain C-terminal PDZ domain